MTYLDGWRGLSIFLVLIGHFTTAPYFAWGTLGVGMFFALSGRLMAEILWERKMPAAPFLVRRFSRVFPTLLAFVVVMLALGRVTAPTGLSALTFSYGYYQAAFGNSDAFGHLWSLCIEEHGYAILLILAAISARSARSATIALVGMILISTGAGLYRTLVLGQDYFHSYWLTDSALQFLAWPALAYLWRERLTALWGRMAPFASVVCGVAAVGLSRNGLPLAVPATLSPALLGVSMAMLPSTKGWMLAMLDVSALRQLGLWSFSIYLWQQPFLNLAWGRGFGMMLLAGAMATVVGVASFRYIEQPARRAINDGVKGWRVARAA